MPTAFPQPPDALSALAFVGDPDIHRALCIDESSPTGRVEVWESTNWLAVYAHSHLVRRFAALEDASYLAAIRFAVELHAVEVTNLGQIVDWDSLR